MKIEEIRAEIKKCQTEIDRSEGEIQSLDQDIQENFEELRTILDCKKGKEKQTLQTLREKIEQDKERVEEILNAVYEKRGGKEFVGKYG